MAFKTVNILEDFSYPEVRKCLAPEYRHLPTEYIEQIVVQTFGETVDPEDVEGFFSDVGKFAKKAAKGVSKALPSVLPVAGTVVGTAFGGPLGGAVGGALGSVAGSAIGSATKDKKPAVRQAVAGAIGTVGPALGAKAGAVGNPATAQLLQTLLQPKVIQGLQSMAMGQAGRANIPVGGSQVPVGAIANLIGSLANQAVLEQHLLHSPEAESIPSYLFDAEGFPIADPAVPEQRAAALLNLLQQERLIEEDQGGWNDEAQTTETSSDESLDEYYDLLELASLHEELEA